MKHELQILILEDSPRDAEFMQRELRRGGMSFSARRVDTREAFVEQLEEFRPDLVIADYMLPSFDGMTALALVRERSAELPFILVSGYIGEERAIEALKSGATDFLLKANLAARLVPAVQRALREVEERAERRRLEEMLRHSQKVEAAGQLTGGISHDFNNLMTVIRGNIELLRETLDEGRDADAIELIDDALSAANDGAELAHRLLAFSRKQSLTPTRIDPNELVADFSRLLSRTIGQDIEVRILPGDDVPAVLADRAQLENALLNLAVNASHAMPNGGTLAVKTGTRRIAPHEAAEYQDVAAGAYVAITVTDTGTGMSPEVLARAFEPFFTTKELGKGSGLGLSMVHGFVKQSGGGIRIVSEVGKGTEISLLLPVAAADAGAQEDAGDSGELPRGSETILVVEDEPRIRRFAVRCLEGLGYRVLEAENAPAALAVLEGGSSVDLVFSDIVMPGGMNGRELARTVADTRPGLKVQLASGFSKSLGGEATGGDQRHPVLRKPYSRARLAHCIRDALDAAEAPSPAGPPL